MQTECKVLATSPEKLNYDIEKFGEDNKTREVAFIQTEQVD